MKIYLAGRFSKRHKLFELGKILENSFGHKIISRWTLPGNDHVIPAGKSRQASDNERARFALEDIEDIQQCDWMISLMDEPRNDGRGGKHVEFGYALAKGLKLTIIGKRETVFHHLPQVDQFHCVPSFLKSCGDQLPEAQKFPGLARSRFLKGTQE